MLAHAIVAQKGVVPGVLGFVHVKKGLSPFRILNFGSHESRSPDIFLPKRHDQAAEAMRQATLKGFATLGCPWKEGFESYNTKLMQCTCWTHVYTGRLCKHAAAFNIMASVDLSCSNDVEQAACTSIRDIVTGVRERERRVKKMEQVDDVLGDDMSVWAFISALVTTSPVSEVGRASEIIADARGSDVDILDETGDQNGGEKTASKTTGWLQFQKEKWAEEKDRGSSSKARSFTDVSAHISHLWWQLPEPVKQTYIDQAESMRTDTGDTGDTRQPISTATGTTHAIVTSDTDTDDKSVRSGPARPIEPKGRNAWKGDKSRPRFGLKSRDRARSGGIATIHRVDASRSVAVNGVRASRITRVAAM